MPNLFGMACASIRRRIIVFFFKDYVKKSLTKRKGKCENCGACCAKIKCRHLSKDKKCKIFENVGYFCKVFPIDETDIKSNSLKISLF